MSTSGSTRDDTELALKFLDMVGNGCEQDFADVMSDDIVIEWPQSSERIRGIKNAQELFSHYPGRLESTGGDRVVFVQGDEGSYALTPMFTMVKASSKPDYFTMIVRSIYPDGTEWYVISLLQTRDGRISKAINYFAPVYEAPEWRSQWVEHMDAE